MVRQSVWSHSNRFDCSWSPSRSKYSHGQTARRAWHTMVIVLSDQHCVCLCTKSGFVLDTCSDNTTGHKMLFNPNPTQCSHLGSLSYPGLSPDDSCRRSSSGTMRVIDHSSTSETLRTRLPCLSALRIKGQDSQRPCIVSYRHVCLASAWCEHLGWKKGYL